MNQRSLPHRKASFLFVCKIRNTGQHKENARQCHPITPHLIFRRIGMRILQPFDDLVSGTCLLGSAHHLPMGFEHIHPEPDFLISRRRRFQSGTPPVRESLESGAFRRGQPAYRIVHVYQRGILVIRGHK